MGGRLAGKVAIVTGAGSIGPGWGNGKAVAALFAREGARVLAVDINAEAVAETKGIIDGEGGDCETARADVSKRADVEAAVQACLDRFGRLDILHNNVGIVGDGGGPVETSEEEWDRVAAINAKSVYLTCKAALPHLEASGAGSIVNVSSIAATSWMNVPYIGYAATKAAILGLTRNIAGQYAARNVRCNAILPGIIDTPLLRKMLADVYPAEEIRTRLDHRNGQIPMKRMGDAWDVAYAALYLASNEAKYVTGAELVVDGGISFSAVSG